MPLHVVAAEEGRGDCSGDPGPPGRIVGKPAKRASFEIRISPPDAHQVAMGRFVSNAGTPSGAQLPWFLALA